MIYGGIDPGKKGAIARLDGHHIDAIEMPSTVKEVLDALQILGDADLVAVEKPIYPAMIGIKNATTIALNYGVLLAGLTKIAVPFVQISPVKWKKSLDLSRDKDLSRQRATELFPDQAHLWKYKRQDGIAEAALLSWWAKQTDFRRSE